MSGREERGAATPGGKRMSSGYGHATLSRTPARASSLSGVNSPGRRKFNTWNPRSSTSGATPRQRFGRPAAIQRARGSLPGSPMPRSSSNNSSNNNKRGGPSVCVMVRVRPFIEVDKANLTQTQSDTPTTTIRPASPNPTADSCIEVIDLDEDNESTGPEIDDDNSSGSASLEKLRRGAIRLGSDSGQTFTFDRVFSNEDDQAAVFADAGRPIAENALNGYNASIFAYGQTGSGKTYTMLGGQDEDSSRGLIPRVLEHCFAGIESLKGKGAIALAHCSFLEIYNEQVFDLLEVVPKEISNAPGYTQAPKVVREDVKRGVFVDGAEKPFVESVAEAFALIKRGSEQRRVGSTNMNRESSRSHSIFTLALELKIPGDTATGTLETTKTARVNLVDLAGSERQRVTQAIGDRLNESKHINKSLSALGNVISALVEKSKGKSTHMHVPYRDSTLTYLLRDSLGGNTKTSIIATVSPDASNYQDTLSTLQFGQRAKRIQLSVRENTTLCSDVNLLRSEIDRLRDELKHQKKVAAAAIVDHTEPSRSDELPTPPAIVKAPLSIAPSAGALLASNPDFVQIEAAVLQSASGVPSTSPTSEPSPCGPSSPIPNEIVENSESFAAGQLILRKRITHLELVLAQLLAELSKNREAVSSLRAEARSRRELEEVLRDQVASKELILSLQEQKLKALETGDEDASSLDQSKTLAEAHATSNELELRREIQDLKADNEELASLYMVGNDDSELQKRLVALEVQLQAFSDDKSELEAMVKQLTESNQTLRKNSERISDVAQQDPGVIFDKAVQEELQEALRRIEELEAQLFSASEQKAVQDVLTERVLISMERKRVQETGSRRHSAGEALELRHKSSEYETLEASTTSHVISRMGVTNMEFSSPSLNDRAASMVSTHAKASRKKLPKEAYLSPEKAPSTPGHATDSTDANADELVRKRLLKQLADTRVQLSAEKKNTRRLTIQLERHSSSAKKTKRKFRKSMSAQESKAEVDQRKVLSLELQLAELREKNNRLVCNNKDLQDAVKRARSFGDFKEKQYKQVLEENRHYKTLVAELDEAKVMLENLNLTEKLGGNTSSPFSERPKGEKENSRHSLNSVSSDTSVATTATIPVKRTASGSKVAAEMAHAVQAEESTAKAVSRRMSAYATPSQNMAKDTKTEQRPSRMTLDAPHSQPQQHRKTLPASVADFFPASSPATSIAKKNVAKALDAERARLSCDGNSQDAENVSLNADRGKLLDEDKRAGARSASKSVASTSFLRPPEQGSKTPAGKKGTFRLPSMLRFTSR